MKCCHKIFLPLTRIHAAPTSPTAAASPSRGEAMLILSDRPIPSPLEGEGRVGGEKGIRLLSGIITLFLLFSLSLITGCAQNPVYLRSVADLNVKAKALMDQGDLDGAISRLESARDLDPGEPNTLFNLGIAYTQKGKLDLASQDFETLLNTGKIDRVKVLEPLAVVYEQKADDLASAAAESPKKEKPHQEKEGSTSVKSLQADSLTYYEKAIQTLQQVKAAEGSATGVTESKQSQSANPDQQEEAMNLDTHIAQLQKRMEEVRKGELKAPQSPKPE